MIRANLAVEALSEYEITRLTGSNAIDLTGCLDSDIYAFDVGASSSDPTYNNTNIVQLDTVFNSNVDLYGCFRTNDSTAHFEISNWSSSRTMKVYRLRVETS